MARAVGIDLGTTNSVVAVLEGGEPTVIANSEGSRTTPSVVAFARNGEVLVGQSAKNQAVTNVDRTIRSVKRHMGSDWTTPEIDGKRYKAQEISARVLQKLKRDAESYLGEEIADAVITVPAYFEDAQRQATKEAGQIAGLNVLRIVNEPTAAALAYGLDKGEKEQTILVFDLGGGTFDVSLLEIGEGVVEVKATNGDNHLGGDDWDERIISWLVDRFSSSTGIDLTKDRMAMQRLREAAEKAKIELSSQTTATINLPYITVDADKNPLFLDETLSRAEFQRITSDLLDRTRAPFNQVIKDASIAVARHRPRRARRRLDPHAGRHRAGQGAHRRQGAEQGRQPGRGRRRRRRAAGRCAPGRGQGRPAARRHPAVAGHRDQGRGDDQAHRAQHHDPDQALGDLHHGRRQPAVGADPGVPGRAGDRGVQQEARHVRADRPAAGAARRAADRGLLRHRRQRHRERLRQGPGHRQEPGHDDHRWVGPLQGRHRPDDARGRAARRGGPQAPRGGRGPQPGRDAGLPDGEVRQGERREAPGGRQGRGQRRAGRGPDGPQGHRHRGHQVRDGEARHRVAADGRGAVPAAGRRGCGSGRRCRRRPTASRPTTSSTPRSSTRRRTGSDWTRPQRPRRQRRRR